MEPIPYDKLEVGKKYRIVPSGKRSKGFCLVPGVYTICSRSKNLFAVKGTTSCGNGISAGGPEWALDWYNFYPVEEKPPLYAQCGKCGGVYIVYDERPGAASSCPTCYCHAGKTYNIERNYDIKAHTEEPQQEKPKMKTLKKLRWWLRVTACMIGYYTIFQWLRPFARLVYLSVRPWVMFGWSKFAAWSGCMEWSKGAQSWALAIPLCIAIGYILWWATGDGKRPRPLRYLLRLIAGDE